MQYAYNHQAKLYTLKAHSIHDPHMHNGPFQVLTLFLKSSKDGAQSILGGSLFHISAASYLSDSFPYFMALNLYNYQVFVSGRLYECTCIFLLYMHMSDT